MLIVPDQYLKLPLIDISPFLTENSSNELKRAVSENIHAACKEVGFFYLTGHGLSNETCLNVQKLAREFFALPITEKQQISIEKNDLARGYQRLGQNITKYAKDWHEAIDVYAPVDNQHTIRKRGIKCLSGESIWPTNPPLFQQSFEQYVHEMKKIGLATMRAIAMGLGLDECYFDKDMQDGFWVMRIIGYPPLASANDSQVGHSCGEHTDYGCLTILNTDDTKDALQVMTKTGEWFNADPIPGAFVVNIGDMLNVWTNNIYQSTKHRVIHKGQNFRISIPFFYEPNFDSVVAPIDKCVENSGQKALYEPVVYGDHLLSKVTNNFDVQQD